MFLKSARITNYRNFKDINVSFEMFSALVGPNNIGKSSILQALEYIFTPTNPRNVVITKPDYSDPSKEIIVDIVFGDLDKDDKDAFYHDDGIINLTHNTITIRFVSSWSSIDQDIVNECYFIRDDLPKEQQRIADFSNRYKQLLPYFIISSDRSAFQELGISKNRDLGKILRVYSSDYLKPLSTLISEIKTTIENIEREKDNWENFPTDDFQKLKVVADDILLKIPPDFAKQIVGKNVDEIDEMLDKLDEEWTVVQAPITEFVNINPEIIFRDHFLKLIERLPILIKRAKIQNSLYELKSGMLEEQKFEDMNLGFKEIFDTMMPGQNIGINLFSIQDDELVSQISVDLDDQSILNTGSGYQSMFVIGLKLVRMLAQLQMSENKIIRNFIIGLEEPENHLHPHMQRHFINFTRKLQQLWKDKGYQLQIITTTHSPSIISRFEPHEIILLQKNNGTTTTSKWGKNKLEDLIQILEPDIKKRGKKANNLQVIMETFPDNYPDVFFSSFVIIVEGETEEGAIPTWAKKTQKPIDFDSKGICVVKPKTRNNMRYMAIILEAFNIDYAVVFDTEDNHNFENVPAEKLLGTKQGEFEDNIIQSAGSVHLLSALIDADNILKNQGRAKGIAGQVKEFEKIEDLDGILEIIKAAPISTESETKLKKNIKSWLDDSKGYILGRLIAKHTEQDEIPKYIIDLLDFVQKRIDKKEVSNAGQQSA
jgi:putative ATP-dependent endonuclease of OLD family